MIWCAPSPCKGAASRAISCHVGRVCGKVPIRSRHRTRCKMALGIIVGVIMGIAATAATFYLASRSLRETRTGPIPAGWSSPDQKWDEFAVWLRQGGRRLLREAAFTAAQDGMSEQEVRATFGPPDFVIAGVEQFKRHADSGLCGCAGAFLSEIGRFVDVAGAVRSEVIAIVLDPAARLMSRLCFAVQDSDTLANIVVDTRSVHRVVAK